MHVRADSEVTHDVLRCTITRSGPTPRASKPCISDISLGLMIYRCTESRYRSLCVREVDSVEWTLELMPTSYDMVPLLHVADFALFILLRSDLVFVGTSALVRCVHSMYWTM
jgi:hypothetical protein